MKYFLIVLLFLVACDDEPKKGTGGGGKDTAVVVVPDTVKPVNIWPDRRPIGMIMLSSNGGDYKHKDAQWKMPNGSLLEHARNCIQYLKYINAQGAITWDIEGQEYPQPWSYIGDPRLVHPDIEPQIDEYFKMFLDSGLRVGVCIRPDSIVRENGWIFHYTVEHPFVNLYNKILYARSRWGCSLFYVDSNIGEGLEKPIDSATKRVKQIDNSAGYGRLMPSWIFKELNERFPDCLIIPEHQDNSYYQFTAPYNDKHFRPLLNEDEKGFQVLNVGDNPFSDEDVINSVKQGNILMGRVWYHSPELDKIKQAYER